MLEYIKGYSGVQAWQILEDLLEADYMYFDGDETHYMIAEAMVSVANCVYGCSHMG